MDGGGASVEVENEEEEKKSLKYVVLIGKSTKLKKFERFKIRRK